MADEPAPAPAVIPGGYDNPDVCFKGVGHYWMTRFANNLVGRRCAKCNRREKAAEMNKDGTIKTWEQVPL